jgi:hypothetical protein
MTQFYKPMKETEMSENNGPFREKEATLDDVMKEIIVVRKTLDYEIPAVKANILHLERSLFDKPSVPSMASRLKEWTSKKVVGSDMFRVFHYFFRHALLVVSILILGSGILVRACSEESELRHREWIESCTTACHSTGSEYTIWHAAGTSLTACTCARPDGTVFDIRGQDYSAGTSP